jgi:hypothetical protein
MIVLRVIVLVCGIVFSVHGVAAGLVEIANGQVRAGPTAVAATAVVTGQRIAAGTTVTTGPRSRAVIRFEDGQAIVLNENSEFRVTEYSFVREQPARDSFKFELIKGALRSVTAGLTRRTPRAYALRAATATMGIRGTDFVVAIVNPVYFRVLSGTVEVFCTDNVPAEAFGSGLAGIVANAKTCAVSLPLSQLPPEIAAVFNDLAGLVVLVDAGTVGAALATTAAEGSITMPAALGIIGAIAVGIAAANSRGDGGSGTTGTR